MSVAEQDPPQTKPSEPFPGLNWVKRHWARVRLGHEGVMLENIVRNRRCVETLARNAMTGDMENIAGWPGEGEEDEGMGVNIGDTIHVHYPPEPEKQATPEPEKQPSLVKKVAPWLLGPALGAGALTGWSALNKPPEQAPEPTPAAERPDKFMRYDIEKWVPAREILQRAN